MYHTPLVEYHHRCACGMCVNVVTFSPALNQDPKLEAQLACEVLQLHLAFSGKPPAAPYHDPSAFEPPDTSPPGPQ